MLSLSGSWVVWSWDAHSLVRSNDVLRFWWEGGHNKPSMTPTWKTITGIITSNKGKLQSTVIFTVGDSKADIMLVRWFTLLCSSWFCCAGPQTTPTAFLWIERSPSESAVKTAAIFNHNRVHLSMVLPFLPSLSLFQSLCSSPLCLLWGGSYFPPNIKPPYRQAHGPPSRGAAWTCCIGCCPFPSCRRTDHIYFPQNDKDFLQKKKKKIQLSGLWIQQNQPQSSSIVVPECIINSDVLLGLRPHLFDFHHWRFW